MFDEDDRRRALVVEDDRLTRALLSEMLRGHDFEVYTADSAPLARQALDDVDPDIALLDVDLGSGPSGIAVAHIIRQEYPATAVLFVTRFPDERMAELFGGEMPPGCGFMRKDEVDDTERLLGAIEEVLANMPEERSIAVTPEHPLAGLTPNQRQVLRMIAQGLTNTAIAHRRGTSPSAVEQMVANILRTLGVPARGDVSPRMAAARIYIETMGLPESP